MELKKIVVIGPESTGKSTLCEGLAAYFRCPWVPEYAREWLTRHGMGYTYEDLLVIAKGQVEGEEEAASQIPVRAKRDGKEEAGGREGAMPKLLFIDTDMYVMKVWSEFVFGRCELWILDQIARRKYDGYLLCRTDLPWAPDPLREYPDPGRREKLFHIYRDCLINQSVPWVEIGGGEGKRLETAIEAVKKMVG
jgi:nicotinamide riboside kinase